MCIIRIFINLFYLLLKAVLSQETWKSHRVMWSVICPVQERVSNSSGSKWLTFIIWIFVIGIFHQNHMKSTSSDIRWYRGVLYPASLLSWLNKYVIFFDSSGLSHGTCAELISPILQCQAVSVIISCSRKILNWSSRIGKARPSGKLVWSAFLSVYSKGSNTPLWMQAVSSIILSMTSASHNTSCTVDSQCAKFRYHLFFHLDSLTCYWGYASVGCLHSDTHMFFLKNYRIFATLRQEWEAE